ncbi:MAG: hypothetical protein INQ03_02470 [Candidatus Heimdallarchaeota archaeon]|nr:hypothetical protein [Candidatus Heimdallarchaeota archaeon]
MQSMLSSEQEKIYSYWDDIPTIKRLDQQIIDAIVEVEVRELILKIMRNGIHDDIFNTGTPRVRHAMTPKTLLELVNLQLKKPVKLSNIYFHLDKLKEFEMIKSVAILYEGKYKQTYFGRTSKLYVFNKNKNRDIENMKIAESVIKTLNPELSEESISEAVKQYLNRKNNSREKIFDWFTKHEQDLRKKEFDTLSIWNILEELLQIDNSTEIKLLRNLMKF